jgi:metal-responsive CopG/Arc/MetJ family transcriptional regulator
MKIKRPSRQPFTSVSIPTVLFKKVEKHLKDTGFPSVSSYVAFILREVITEDKQTDKTAYEAEKIKQKLRDLGYM